MRRVSHFVVSILVFLASAVYGQSVSSQADDRAIRDLIQQYVNARNSRDVAKTTSLFTVDADQLVSTGEWRRGIDAVIRGSMASSRKEIAKSSIQVEAIRFLEPGIALADGRYQTISSVTNASRSMWTTLILKRTDQGWRITAIRNMLPAPAASSASPPH